MLNTLVFSSIQTSLGSIILLFISSKISKSPGILSRSKQVVPTDTSLRIYRSVI